MHNHIIRTGILAFAAFLSANAQTEWTSYGGDPGSQRYSKLKQIDTKNVQNLKRAWTFHTGDSSGFFESAPLVINSVVYFTSPNAGVFALELETGKQIWKYEAKNFTRRGLSYWPGDAQSSPRLITGVGNTMIALDLKTGKLIPGFGKEGVVDIAPTRMESAPVI
jgi:glucose dehydrogenase